MKTLIEKALTICRLFDSLIQHVLIGFLLILILNASNASAFLIERDYQTLGDNLFTLDTQTGLLWLDVPVTSPQSKDSILDFIAEEDFFWGIRDLNSSGQIISEVEMLMQHAGIVNTFGVPTAANDAGVLKLLALMGETTVGEQYGIFHNVLGPTNTSSSKLVYSPGASEAHGIFDSLVHTSDGRNDRGQYLRRIADPNSYESLSNGNNSSSLLGGTSSTGGVTVTFDTNDDGVFLAEYNLENQSEFLKHIFDNQVENLNFAIPGENIQWWDLDYKSDFGLADPNFGTALVQLKYDDSELGQLFNESDLQVFHFRQGAWELVATTVDTDANIVSFSTNSFSPFALGMSSSVIPEPTTILLFGGGLLGSILKRKIRFSGVSSIPSTTTDFRI